MNEDQDSILEIHHAWIDAEQRGDIEAMLELCAQDVRFIPPNMPSKKGKDTLREFLQKSGDVIKELEISNMDIEISGSLAYKTASFVAHVEELDASAVQTIRGTHLWVLRREGFQWKIAIVAWSIW